MTKTTGQILIKTTEFNIVIKNEFYEREKDLIPGLFNGEEIVLVDSSLDMYDILKMCGLFSSKSEARKNWTRTGKEVPKGFSDFERIGKMKHRLTIFNPIKTISDHDDKNNKMDC